MLKPSRRVSAVYLRVSTEEQSFDSQKEEVLRYCKTRGWKNLTIYAEKKSGAKTSRPVLDQMIREIREGRIERVIAYKLDRIGRSLAHLALIIEEMVARKVPMIFTSQGIDTSDDNPLAPLIISVLMGMAQVERSYIRERTKAGQAAARKRGRIFGRPATAAKLGGRIRELKRAGMSVRAIARELRISPASASRYGRRTR